MLDGQGIDHERRLGIATPLGLVTNATTIGSAKSRLAGKYTEPANEIFAQSPMYEKGELVGRAPGSKKDGNPIFISPTNTINIAQGVDVIKHCI